MKKKNKKRKNENTISCFWAFAILIIAPVLWLYLTNTGIEKVIEDPPRFRIMEVSENGIKQYEISELYDNYDMGDMRFMPIYKRMDMYDTRSEAEEALRNIKNHASY